MLLIYCSHPFSRKNSLAAEIKAFICGVSHYLEGLEFYDSLFDELIKYGIEPVVTLSHFEMPLHLAKAYGGFTNRKVTDCYVRFAKVCFERYRSKVKYWITFNEINNQMN